MTFREITPQDIPALPNWSWSLLPSRRLPPSAIGHLPLFIPFSRPKDHPPHQSHKTYPSSYS